MAELVSIATTEGIAGRVALDGDRWIAGGVSDAVVYEGFEAPRELARMPAPLGADVRLFGDRACADFSWTELGGGSGSLPADTGLSPPGPGAFSVHTLAWIPPGEEALACAVFDASIGSGAPAWSVLVLGGEVLAEGADDLAPRALAASERYLVTAALEVRVYERDHSEIGAVPPLYVFTRALDLLDGRLAAGSADGSVAIASCERPEDALRWAGHEGECRGVALAADGRLASGGDDGRVRLWSPDGALLAEHALPGRVQDVALGTVLLASWRAPDRLGVTALQLP